MREFSLENANTRILFRVGQNNSDKHILTHFKKNATFIMIKVRYLWELSHIIAFFFLTENFQFNSVKIYCLMKFLNTLKI